ncbi:MAG TPA: HEAT repeat domain-containing protein [Anaeromyxobacteraceae bacterium]|nr:HEAT repeat domain-containing protein [Anaeromyxobacteraceae bacterium]
MSGSPEELLRSALEKVIFFECRVASLEHELDAARTTAARSREEAGAARRRETELEQAAAQLRGGQAMAVVHNSELVERVRLLEAERERFLSGMVESARVAGAPADVDGDAGNASELAGFISELRAEIEELRAFKQSAVAAGFTGSAAAISTTNANATATSTTTSPSVPTPIPTTIRAVVATPAVEAIAARMERSGRITVTREDARALPSFPTRSERALYETCLDDLAARDPAQRRRAADGLRALGSKNAAPLLAAALGREADADVKVSLLAALGALAESNAADLALRELSDPRPGVRAAALDAASALGKERAVPTLAGALADPSALVRRRAVVLLGFARGEAADDALAAALSDRDAGVTRAAASALSGRPSARAQGALAKALQHPEPAVRRAAALATARWSGEQVDTAAPEQDRRSAARRISEKLLTVQGEELRSAVTRVAVSATVTAPATAKATPTPTSTATRTATVIPSAHPERSVAKSKGERTSAPAALLRSAVLVAEPDADPSLADAALSEVRMALRGRTAEELAGALARDRLEVENALRSLVAQGRLVARGPRFFMS